jgi:hypothetical protein
MKWMMNKLPIIILTATVTGCAFGPGHPVFDRIALHYDQADPCQTGGTNEARRKELARPEGYQMPSWCGGGRASVSRRIITDRNGQTIGYIR